MDFRCSRNLPPSARILLTRLPRTGPVLRRHGQAASNTPQAGKICSLLQLLLLVLLILLLLLSLGIATTWTATMMMTGTHGDERAAAAAARTTRMSMTRMIGIVGKRHGAKIRRGGQRRGQRLLCSCCLLSYASLWLFFSSSSCSCP